MQEVFNFDRREIAVLCVLLLRGPQTPGELRSRTERMYRFEALEDIVATTRPPAALFSARAAAGCNSAAAAGDERVALHAALFRRCAHREMWRRGALARVGPCPRTSADDRLSHLENEVLELKRELADMQQQLSTFRKQFE